MRVLDGRVAVVTGAGSGIGRALAAELASRGCALALTDLDADRLAEPAEAARARGVRVTTHGFDVRDPGAWPDFVDALRREHGRVHLVLNNAGVSLHGPFLSCSLEDLQWQIDVNLWGVVHGCHFLLPLLLEQEEAHLVNVSSIFGIIAMPDNAAYCMSKHAVRALTETLEIELRHTRVRISSVHPGAVATRIVEDGRFRAGGVSAHRAKGLIAAGLTPESAARRIVAGIQRNERRILVGRDARALALLHWLMPVRYRDLVAAVAGRFTQD